MDIVKLSVIISPPNSHSFIVELSPMTTFDPVTICVGAAAAYD